MILKELNSIDVKDLKNIDWRRMANRIQSRPDLAINIVLVIATLVTLLFTYKRYLNKTQDLEDTLSSLEETSEAIDKMEIIRKEYSDFQKSIPDTINANQLIETLSKFALKRDVQILSFSPANKKSNKFISLTSVEINVISENYADIILFMRDIESAPYAIRVEKWSGASIKQDEAIRGYSRRSSRRIDDVDPEKEFIEATIKIESVELKYG